MVWEEAWEQVVAERTVWFDEWGCPYDARKELPAREYQAHLAILEGRNRRRKEEHEKQVREARAAKGKGR